MGVYGGVRWVFNVVVVGGNERWCGFGDVGRGVLVVVVDEVVFVCFIVGGGGSFVFYNVVVDGRCEW